MNKLERFQKIYKSDHLNDVCLVNNKEYAFSEIYLPTILNFSIGAFILYFGLFDYKNNFLDKIIKIPIAIAGVSMMAYQEKKDFNQKSKYFELHWNKMALSLSISKELKKDQVLINNFVEKLPRSLQNFYNKELINNNNLNIPVNSKSIESLSDEKLQQFVYKESFIRSVGKIPNEFEKRELKVGSTIENDLHKHTTVFSDIYEIKHSPDFYIVDFDLFEKKKYLNNQDYGVQFVITYDPEPSIEEGKKISSHYGGLYTILRDKYNNIISITPIASTQVAGDPYNSLIRMIKI